MRRKRDTAYCVLATRPNSCSVPAWTDRFSVPVRHMAQRFQSSGGERQRRRPKTTHLTTLNCWRLDQLQRRTESANCGRWRRPTRLGPLRDAHRWPTPESRTVINPSDRHVCWSRPKSQRLLAQPASPPRCCGR